MRFFLKWSATALFFFLVVTGGIALWMLFAPLAPLEDYHASRFTHDQCRRVALRETDTGRAIVGVEDIARLPDGTLLLSAHNRLDPAMPDGGIYALYPAQIDRVFDEEKTGPIDVASVISAGETKSGLRPHGIAINEAGNRLGLINRGRDGTVSIEIYMRAGAHEDTDGNVQRGGSWKPLARGINPRWCRANDLDFSGSGDKVMVTLDRKSCSVSVVDLIGLFPTGEVWVLDLGRDRIGGFPPHAVNRYRFPNGISGDWVAETRGNALTNRASPRLRGDGKSDGSRNGEVSRISLQGGPDNLHRIDAKSLSVALHPSLPRLGAYRYGWTSSAPSRAALADLTSGATEILFDDPDGAVYSGASVAVLDRNLLVLGSVRDAGILLCRE